MGSFIRLPPRALDGRIDATYYRPEYVTNAQRLASSAVGCSELSNLVSGGRRTLYFGTTTLEGDEAPSDWVPFLTADDLGDEGFFIETRARRRVAPAFLGDYPAGRLRSGELLVKVKGPNQTTAYIDTAPAYPVLVSGTIWGGLVRKDVVDPYYLVAALSCPYAAMARTRLRTNLNVEFLSAEDLLSLSLPTPDKQAQRYIGDKVRQAERLRQGARQIAEEATQVLALASWQPSQARTSSFRIQSEDIEARRLNPHFYAPDVRDLVARLATLGACSLRADVTIVDGRWGRNDATISYADISALDVESGLVWPAQTAGSDAPGRAQILLRDYDILVSTVDPSRKNVGLLVPGTYAHRPVASNGYCVLRCGSAESAALLHWMLRSDYVTRQLTRWAAGAIFAAIPDDAVRELLLLPVSDARRSNLGTALLKRTAMLVAAKSLVESAKRLLENLIDRRIAEVELVAAQNALEAGNRSADNVILKALRQSDASDAMPVIADVDALYSLLDGSEGQDA